MFKKGDLVVFENLCPTKKKKDPSRALPYVILDPKGMYDGFARALRADGKIEQICVGSFILAVG